MLNLALMRTQFWHKRFITEEERKNPDFWRKGRSWSKKEGYGVRRNITEDFSESKPTSSRDSVVVGLVKFINIKA